MRGAIRDVNFNSCVRIEESVNEKIRREANRLSPLIQDDSAYLTCQRCVVRRAILCNSAIRASSAFCRFSSNCFSTMVLM